MVNGKAMIIILIAAMIKNTWHKGVNIYQNQNLWGDVKVELDLSNYATKADLKNSTGGDISKFTNKADLASLNQKLIN